MTRTVCAWCSRSLPIPKLLVTIALSLLAAAAPARGTTYVPMSDADLADQASLVVEGRVLAVAPAPVAGRPSTDYTVEVVRTLQGVPTATPLTVRVPGGRSPEGAVFRVWGAPELEAGERAILFLSPRGDGTLGIHQLMLGVFREEVRGERTLAVRDLSEARAVALDGGPARGEAPGLARDYRAFAEWLAARGSNTDGSTGTTGPYFVEVPAGEEGRLAPRYTLLGSDQHFRWFNGGGTWYAHQAGQGGMSGGGFSEFQAALNAWNADTGSALSLTYGGTTSRSSGFRSTDGANVILFDDPNGEISGSFSCSSGGVLAIGGFSNVSGSGSHNGETYWKIVEGEVVTQDGAGCYFAANGGKNGELVFAHEVGHALGLGHSCGDSSSPSCSDPVLDDAIMRSYAHGDGRGARLGSDDRAAIAVLYGSGGGGCSVPAAPDSLAATAASSSRIDLAWRDRASDEQSYVVERRAPGASAFSKVASLAAGSRAWSDTGLAAGATYSYRVQAVGCGGGSAWAGPASATTPAGSPTPPPPPPPPPPPEDDPPPEPGPAPGRPQAPTGVDARAPSSTSVVLSWTDRSGGTAATHVEVKTGAAFHEARVTPAGQSATTFTGLDAGRTYTFRVRARNAAGYSPYSAAVAVRTPAPAPPAGTLTQAQVACDAARLAGLLERFGVAAPASDQGTGVNLSLTATGDFAGVAYTPAGPGSPESHLAFSTNPEETTLLRNPERKQLASVSLTRNHLASDLVGAGDAGRLRLTLNPTLSASPDPASLLAVENLAGAADRATSARPGRGLGPLVEGCHAGFSGADVHVFRVLEKIARARVEGAKSYEIAVYRAPRPDTYRLDVYPLRGNGAAMGRFAVELRVTRDAGGALVAGTLRALGRCSAGQSLGCSTVTAYAELTLGRPTLEGTKAGATVPKVVLQPSGAGAAGEAAVDWKAVLAGTTWRRPLAGAAPVRTESAVAELRDSEVTCDATRLAGFLERLGLEADAGAGAPAVNLSYTATGDFAGIAYRSAPGAAAGPQLAFSTNPEETTLLRNPERPQLASVSLTRNLLSSDLVAPGAGGGLRVLLNPTLAEGSGNGPGVLVIDNRDGAAGGSTDAKPGRGIAPLLAPCHAHLADRDVHVFRVLSKLLRARTDGAAGQKIAIYRGTRQGVYRIDVYPQAPQGDWGRLAAELEVGFGPGDELRTATLRVLASCRPGGPAACTDVARATELFLVAPAPPGAAREVTTAAVSSASPAAKDSIDFRDLLTGTTWQRPL